MDKIIAAVITLVLGIAVGLFFVIPNIMVMLAFIACVLIVAVIVYVIVLTIVQAAMGRDLDIMN